MVPTKFWLLLWKLLTLLCRRPWTDSHFRTQKFTNFLKVKSNLYYSRLISFQVSRVSGAQGLRQEPHIKVSAVEKRF